jgi:hypothetical protein
MKSIFMILLLGLLVETVSAVQPVRKPFLQIKIDGKSFKNGDIITVSPGQKLNLVVELEGGRRDFCKFPDTYADIVGIAQILSRGDNGITYQLNGIKAEWKLQSEIFQFTSDNNMNVKSAADQNSAELTVSDSKFAQSFVKASVNATWQFIQEGKTIPEEDLAEETIYFKIAGSSDVWFSSQNIQAIGIKDDLVQEKLTLVQAACDSIEKNFYRLNFSAVQQAIRNLQGTVTTLKSTIDEVKQSNPSYQSKIVFLGLPSDHPYGDIEVFASIKADWVTLQPLVGDLKTQAGKLPAQPEKENKKELASLIGQYADWISKLPETTMKILPVYIPEFKLENIPLPGNLSAIVSNKSIPDYSQTLNDFNAFLDQRTEQIPNEIQLINSIHSRLQAVRLFDGMLRSYFSSISWADWQSTRGF